MPCYKRHQQRASCSGKRDPAAYLKKSQLATAAGIDRDYNYLKGVERHIDDASADARDRGVAGTHAQTESHSHLARRGGAFQKYLRDNQITVEYAPKGMSRQKSNQSRVTKNDNIFWTVEWRDESGEQELRDNAPESSTLRELYKGVQAAKRKRKLATEASVGANGPASKRVKGSQDATAPAFVESGHKAETTATGTKSAEHADAVQPPTGTSEQHEHHFYLLKTSTGASAKVLIPLDAATTLTGALKGQTVQEYPTVYVLRQPSDSLPDGFVHMKDYQPSTGRKGVGASTSGSSGRDTAVASERTEANGAGDQLDSKAILDMLKRDVRA